MEGDELPLGGWDRVDLGLVRAVQRCESGAVSVGIRGVGWCSRGIERAKPRHDGRHVVIGDKRRIEPEVRVRVAIDRDGGDAVAEHEAGDRAFAGRVDELVEEVVEPDAVGDDEVRAGKLTGVLGLGLVVLGPGAGGHDRADCHSVAADVADDVCEDGGRRDDVERRCGRGGACRGVRASACGDEDRDDEQGGDRPARTTKGATRPRAPAHAALTSRGGCLDGDVHFALGGRPVSGPTSFAWHAGHKPNISNR